MNIPIFNALFFLIILVMTEILFRVITYSVRADFQWFITPKDEVPSIEKEGLSHFIEHGFDPELGWVRKPNTTHEEVGRDGKKTTYNIGKDGERESGHSRLKKKIATYGDSFCFCRQNNDNTTWQWYLSELSRTNVLNFGVGNYGLDQALLRLKRSNIKTETVILCVVPSTIVRCLCVWKHYNEYGNTFGFKPRFDLNNGELVLYDNIVKTEYDFQRLKELVPFLQNTDYFYKTKFRKEMIRFPYTYHFLKNWRRNIPIAWWVTKGEIDKAMMKIMDINLKLRVDLYKKEYPVDLLLSIVKDFELYAKEKGFKPVLMIIPQKDDIEYIKKKKDYYYEAFLGKAKTYMKVIDTTSFLLEEKDLNELYSDDNKYGGHPCPKGNEKIANYVWEELRREL
jgi:hypothetical protein